MTNAHTWRERRMRKIRRRLERIAEAIKKVSEEIEPPKDRNELLDKDIMDLDLSSRVFNGLESAGVRTIRDLVQKNASELLKRPGFGPLSLIEVKGMLNDMGLNLYMQLDEEGELLP